MSLCLSFLDLIELVQCVALCLLSNCERKFLAIISSIFFLLLSDFPLSGTPIISKLIYLVVSHRSLRLFSFSFLLFKLDNFNWLSLSSVILTSAQMCYWNLWVNFSFWLLYFSAPEFLLSSFYNFLSLLIVSVCWDIIFLFSFGFSSIIYFSSSIFKTVYLKPWFSNVQYLCFLRHNVVNFFWNGPYFLVSFFSPKV